MPVFRLLGSMIAATVVVILALAIGLNIWYGLRPRDEDLVEVRSIDMLGERERRELADLLGDNDPPPPPKTVAPLEMPSFERRVRQGFVQLEVSVSDDGSIEDVTVVGAFPAGVYEQQAIETIRQQRLRPSPQGTVESRIEVIEFDIPDDGD